MTEPRVLIIILNYKTYELTLKLTEQLRDLDYPNYLVLVIDNCSPNGSAKILKEHSVEMNFEFIANDKNGGYAAGNNIGIRYGIAHGYGYSWILNNDVRLIDRQILKKLVHQAESNSHIACVGPRITDTDGFVTAPYVQRPTRWSMTLGIASAKKSRAAMKDKSGAVYRVYGCCMLLKNSFMEKINCMDERTFLFCEEEILAERLRSVQAYSYYCSDADIIHLESMTVKKEHGNRSWKRRKIVLDSMDLYLKDYLHYGPVSRFLCKFVRCAILILREGKLATVREKLYE